MQRPAKPFTPVRFRLQPPYIMKVGIVGFGFVGRALKNGLKDNVDCVEIDPKLGTNLDDLKNYEPSIVFICLPTPMNDDGSQNIKLVKDTINKINKFNQDILIVVKSTILPKYIEDFSSINNDIVINPEFLRENFANEDFINSEIIVFGGEEKNCAKLGNFYEEHTKCICKDYVKTDLISASLLKYTINCFLALKVIFFNELKSVFDNSNSNNNWSNFISSLSRDKRIGDSHMSVPGPDGRYGFGGPCFPKDVNALVKYSQEIGAELKLLKKANNINNNIRAKYNDETVREKEQNIRFNTEGED
jgi:nucleotide sugar dehydrogenase